MANQQTELKKKLDRLPDQFTRDEIWAMIKALQDDLAREDPPLAYSARVARYSKTHETLLYGMPVLFTRILQGKLRPCVIDAILDERDAVSRGVDPRVARDHLIKRAVDEVSETRRREREVPVLATPEVVVTPHSTDPPDTDKSEVVSVSECSRIKESFSFHP
jgi:hypothetical protein